jgi:coenzyme PQQ precursor peptide PqqA
MKQRLKPEIEESQAGMEVTSYLPAELDRAYTSADYQTSPN